MWPIQLAFLLFIVCKIFPSSLTLCNTSSLIILSVQQIFSIFLQHHISKLCRYSWSYFRSVPSCGTKQSYAPSVAQSNGIDMKCLAWTLKVVVEQKGVLFDRRDCVKQYSIFFSSEAFDRSSLYVILFFRNTNPDF